MALSPNFSQVEVDLLGIKLSNPTSLQFGPDGRLYVSQQNGLIRSYDLKPVFNQDGTINKFVLNQTSGADEIDLVQDIPNHNDDGSLNLSVGNRQVTGLVVEEGPNGETVLYVSSSDPRIGAGPSGNEKDIDTNSGIISRLTKTGNGDWEKVDLVIGLPRSEENHSTNGMDIRTEMVDGQPHQIMYVVSGGSTNRGAPSNNFAWTPEYYYSAAVLRVDLTQLEQIEATEGLKGGTDYVDQYVYALPTLNDPTRPDDAEGRDISVGTTGPADAEAGDTFGGNDGRNQAKYDPDGPVQVYSTGYRNAYDIVITENNNIYTFDNGPNNGWGDVPLEGDGQTPITSGSQVATNHPNIDVDTGNDKDKDNLHLVTEGFYGGSPVPVYATGPAAGLYWVDTSSGSPVVKQLTDPSDPSNDPTTLLDDLPSDWDTVAGGLTHPEAGVYLGPGDNPFGDNKGPDGSLVTISSSTNGLSEYVAGKATGSYPVTDIPGAEVLLAVSFNNNLYFMEIVGDGTQAGTNLTDISSVNIGVVGLDVREVDAFAVGTGAFKDAIFIAQFGGDSIGALVPGVMLPTPIDKDEDGVLDDIDPLQFDAVNGTSTLLNPGETLFWDFNPADGTHPGPSGAYNIGMNGWMVNESWWVDKEGKPEERFVDPPLTDLDNTIRGGAPGVFQVKTVTPGDLEGTGNDQQDALQTGFLPGANVDKFTIKVPLFNPFTSDANNGVTFSESAAVGFALGDGTMSNWIGITVAADDSNSAQIKLTYEENDTSIDNLSIAAPELLTAFDDDLVELFLTVDTNTYEVTPSWRYQTQGVWSDVNQLGSSPVQLNSSGAIVEALQGNKFIDEFREFDPVTGEITINPNPVATVQSAPVVTLISTSNGSEPFTADFPELTISTPSVVVQESSSGTEVTEGGAIDTYSLTLTTQPTSDVTVTLSPDAEVSLDKTELTFTPSNWATPQEVTITAVDDAVQEGPHTGQIAHQLTTTDADYSSLTVPNLVVDVVDDDVPELLLEETDGSTEVAEGGVTDTYSLKLSIQPTSDVTVTLSPDAQVTLDKTEVVFTPSNWDIPQQVTIAAVQDLDGEGNHTGQIAHQVSSSDTNYDGLIVDNLGVSIIDDDQPDVLYRINVGGPQLASADASTPDWSEDTNTNPSPFRIGTGGSNTFTTSDAIDLSDPSLLLTPAPEALFKSERWDPLSGQSMQWELPVISGSQVTVNLYFAEIYKVLVDPDQREFDVSVEGVVPLVFDNIDPYERAGYGGFMLSHTLTVNDDALSLEFLHGIENPALKGIEILSSDPIDEMDPTITTGNSVTIPENQTYVLDVNATDPNGDTEGNGLTYQSLLGADAALFTIDPNTGVISFISAPDFENPLDNDGDNVYQLEVIVEDSTGRTDLQTLAVSVSDVNEPGAATLEITVNSNNVQSSNFGSDSFQITNTGDKNIAKVEIDVTNALYPDSVFDPYGIAGDTAAKLLQINTDGGTGIIAPDNGSQENPGTTYIGTGGIAGYEGIQLLFDDTVNSGFQSGETLGFSVDMDPNSIAGATKSTLDPGAVPSWDIGGVSGAELIGSTFTVTFTDGTTATGQLHGANNQAGAKGLASQDSPNLAVSLTVNGLGAGGVGTYSDGGPSVIVNGPAGETARVVLTKGIIQPVNNNFSEPYASQLDAQLDALAASDFPANNAAEFQTVDVVLTGGDQDISSQFDFTQVAIGNPLAVDEAQVPLGLVASVIDPTNNDLPLGPVTQPIYLEFAPSYDPPLDNLFGTAVEISGDRLNPTDAGILAVGDNIVTATQEGELGVNSVRDRDIFTFTVPDGFVLTGIELQDFVNDNPLLSSGFFGIQLGDQLTVDVETGEPDPGTDGLLGGMIYSIANVGQDLLDIMSLGGEPEPGFEIDPFTPELSGEITAWLNQGAGPNTSTLNFIVEVAPNNTPPITIEAETIGTLPGASVTGYRVEDDTDASGGAMLSFSGGSSNETGSASFTFTARSGTYDVVLGAFDENDGAPAASLQVAQNSSTIGTVVLDQDPGSNGATANAKVERLAATGVNILNGDTITVTGFESGGEHARFDFIRFEPTGPVNPQVSIAASQNGNEEGPVNAQFTVNLSEATTNDTVVSYSLGGSATEGSDYTALPGSVTILGGETSATIDVTVVDDSEMEGNEDITITLDSITAGDSDVVLSTTNNSAAVTIIDNDSPPTPITIEAEDADTIVNYRTENLSAASGGQVLSFVGGAQNEVGSATFVFGDQLDELTGNYDIAIAAFDEGDGLASLTLELNDFETGTTTEIGTLELNQNLGSNLANAQTFIDPIVATGINLTTGDSLTVHGFENASEHARFDFIQLNPIL